MTREEIERNTVLFLRTAGGTRPDVRVVELHGRGRVVVKDFMRSDYLFRLLVAPILVARECGALRRLKGIDGAPQFICRIDRYSFAMEDLGGVSLKTSGIELPDDFFSKLACLVREIHSRGVAHCDLRSAGNVVLRADGTPGVVDFAACVMRGSGLNPFINFLFRQFSAADDYAVILLKRKYAAGMLTDEEKRILDTPMPYERAAVWIGKSVRNLVRRLLTRKKQG